MRIIRSENFHSKGFLLRKNKLYALIVGSSNLTASALCLNLELNLKLDVHKNSKLIKKYMDEVNRYIDLSEKVSNEFISE